MMPRNNIFTEFEVCHYLEYSGGSRISRRGASTSEGGAESRGSYISKNFETKESGPLGR